MGRVGQIVSIPTGAYCNITLDSGEKIVVNHEPSSGGASAGARLTVERLKLMGFSSEVVVEIKLDTAEGQAALAELTKAQDAPGPPSCLRRVRARVRVGGRGRRTVPAVSAGPVTRSHGGAARGDRACSTRGGSGSPVVPRCTSSSCHA